MKKNVIIFLAVFLFCKGFSQNSNKIGFCWYSSQIAIRDEVFLNLFVKEQYQSTIGKFADESLRNTDINENTLDSLRKIFLNMFKDEYRPFFEDSTTDIDIDFHNIEIVFNPRESVIIMSVFEREEFRMRLRTRNKLFNFFMYIEKNNSLPKGTFDYLTYRFNVLKNGEVWFRVAVKVNADVEIVDICRNE